MAISHRRLDTFISDSFGFAIFVILASRYVTIRQRQIWLKIKNNSKQFIIISKNNNKSFRLLLSSFYKLNQKLLFQNNDLQAYSNFWSPYLTIGLPSLVLIFSYELYFLINNNDIPLMEKYYFITIVVQLIFVLYLIIRECAQVVKCNGRCLVENRRFYLKFVQNDAPKQSIDLLKVNITNF